MNNPEILKTKNYDQFTDIVSNREVDKAHVRTLVKAIKEINLLHLNPIIVNSDFQIIDGQHRLEAARQLEIEIYYLVDNQVEAKHIAGLNSNQKHWNLMDYANYFAVQKVPEYLVLADFINRYPFAPITTMLQLLSESGTSSREGFKNGKINVQATAHATKVLDFINKIRGKGIQMAYDRPFIQAIAKIYRKVEDLDENQLLEKITKYRAEIYYCSKMEQYLQLLEGIYNKFMHEKVRFY